MNILIYTHSWFPFINGVTMRYKQIIDILKINNNIILINPYGDEKYDGIHVIKITEQNIPSILLNDNEPKRENKIASILHYPQLFLQVNQICKKYKIDIIHCCGPDPMQILLKNVGIYNDIPLVIMLHTNLMKYSKKKQVTYISYKTCFLFSPDLYVLPSKSYYDELIETKLFRPSYSYYIIPPCVDHSIFFKTQPLKKKYWTNDKIRLLYVGRVDQEKNIESIFHSMDETMSLCIVGKGGCEYKKHLCNISKNKNIDVAFIGRVDSNKLRYWYSSCDIFIMPSKTETLGFVTLEALACQAPVCAFNEGGTTDIIKHKINGYLYNNQNELRMYINLIYGNDEIKNSIITNGVQFIKNKTVENSVQALFSEYKKLIK
jgi:glycosyltransferase involved in cell wall biosynthesis